MDQDAVDAIKKLTVVATKLTKTLEALLIRIEDTTPLNLAVGRGPTPGTVQGKTVTGAKRIPDRHDRANLEFAQRYGPPEEVDRLIAEFDWSTKPTKGD